MFIQFMVVWNTYFSVMTTKTGNLSNANADAATQMS